MPSTTKLDDGEPACTRPVKELQAFIFQEALSKRAMPDAVGTTKCTAILRSRTKVPTPFSPQPSENLIKLTQIHGVIHKS